MSFLDRVTRTNQKISNMESEGLKGGNPELVGLEVLCGYVGSNNIFSSFHYQIARGKKRPTVLIQNILSDKCYKIYERFGKRNKRRARYTKTNVNVDDDKVLDLIYYTINSYMRYYLTDKQPPLSEICKHLKVSTACFRMHYEDLYLDFRSYLGRGLDRVERNGLKKINTKKIDMYTCFV